MAKRGKAEHQSVQPESRSWQKFTRGRRRCVHLASPALYSLPKRLIAILRDTVNGLFLDQDVAFETALRQFGTTAFVNRQPVICDLLDAKYLTSQSADDGVAKFSPYQGEFDPESIADLSERIRNDQSQQFRALLSADKFSGRDLQRKVRDKFEVDVRLRQLGFAGWLVSNADYRRDVLRLESLRDERPLPGPELFSSGGKVTNRSKIYLFESRNFLTKWALSQVITWDLPVPLCPGLFPGDDIPKNGITPTGVSMFLPWPFLVDQKFQIRRLADFYRTRIDLSYLSGWLSKKDKWGALRYSRLMEMYIYFELALKQRYSERIEQRLAKIDLAFAKYWKLDEAKNAKVENMLDTVEEVRRKLTKRLEECDACTTQPTGRNQNDPSMLSARQFFEAGANFESTD